MSKNRTLADFISTSSVSAEEIANGAVTVVKLANTTSSNGTSLIQMSGHSTALNITPSGRIGIDTNNPNQKLHVHDSSTNATHIRTTNSNGDIFYGLDGNGAGYAWMNSGAGDFYVGTNGAGNLIAYAGSAERMRIDSNGKVGINQTSMPGNFALHVTGLGGGANDARAVILTGAGNHTTIGSTGPTLALQNTDSTTNNIVKLSFESASAGETVSINAINTNHSSHYGDIAFNTRGSNGYSEKMRIMADGNVGIGTTNPLSRLHINNTSSAFYMGYGGNQDIYLQTTNGNIIFSDYNAANERMRINSSGHVGIGTSSPSVVAATGGSKVLHIHNSAASSASVIHLTNSTTGSGATNGALFEIWEDGDAYLWNYEAQPIVFGTSSTQRMIIDALGTVTIGTNGSPTAGAFTRPRLYLKAASDTQFSIAHFEPAADTSVLALGYNATDNVFTFGTSYRSSGAYRDLEFLRLANVNSSVLRLPMGNTSTEVVFNEDSADIDFRVESNDNTGMLFVDAGNNRVGIGSPSPRTTLNVFGNASEQNNSISNYEGQYEIRGAQYSRSNEWVHGHRITAGQTHTTMYSWYAINMDGGYAGQGAPGVIEVDAHISGGHASRAVYTKFIIIPSNEYTDGLHGGLGTTSVTRTFYRITPSTGGTPYGASLSLNVYVKNNVAAAGNTTTGGVIYCMFTHHAREPFFTTHWKYLGQAGTNGNFPHEWSFLGSGTTAAQYDPGNRDARNVDDGTGWY